MGTTLKREGKKLEQEGMVDMMVDPIPCNKDLKKTYVKLCKSIVAEINPFL